MIINKINSSLLILLAHVKFMKLKRELAYKNLVARPPTCSHIVIVSAMGYKWGLVEKNISGDGVELTQADLELFSLKSTTNNPSKNIC